LVESAETDDTLHVVGIGVAGCGLKNELRLFDAGLRRDGQHHGRDLVHRRDIENKFGSAGICVWPLRISKMMGAVVVKPSFQPGNGYDIADSTMLGRTMLRTISFSA